MDDPDADGLSNLMEYALAGQPGVPNNAANQTLGQKVGANFVLTFTRNDLMVTAGDVALVLEYGTNLVGWTHATIPNGAPAAFFSRLRAVK